MKLRNLLFGLLTIPSLLSKAQCDNDGKSKGLYINTFVTMMPTLNPNAPSEANMDFNNSILGNKEKEDALIYFAKSNKFDYLVFYGTSPIFRYGTGSNIYQKVQPLLASFLNNLKAAIPDVEIGLAFGGSFTDFVEFNGIRRVTEADVIENLDNDLIFEGWETLHSIMNTFPNAELTINPQINAMVSVAKFNRYMNAQMESALESVTINTLVTEYEWWNHNLKGSPTTEQKYEAVKARFNNLETLLDAMNAAKDRMGLDRVEVYQSFYKSHYSGQDSSEYYYRKWTDVLTKKSDRALLVVNTNDPEKVGNTGNFKEVLNYFNSYWNQRPVGKPKYQVVPLYYSQSDKFYDPYETSSNPFYSSQFGDILSAGPGIGKSVQQLQKKFESFIPNWSATDTIAINKVEFPGYHWFTYSMSPNMLYVNQLQAGKFNPILNALSYELRSYYTTLPVNLEVFNAVRSPFGTSSSSANNGNTYNWYLTNSTYSSHSLITTGSSTPVISITNSGIYYVTTTDSLGCLTYSIPVKISAVDSSLYMKDFDTAADNGSETNFNGNLWISPDIWVNQDSSSTDRGTPLANRLNWVHAKIRNRSSSPSGGHQRLNLYYSRASTGLRWPISWIDYSENNGYGDRINKIPFDIPSIPGNSSIQIAFKWDDLENASDLEISPDDVTSDPAADSTRHYCLLARIERSEYPSYGMHIAEEEFLPTNVGNNNNIAWRNVIITYEDGGIVTTGGTPKTLTNTLGWSTESVLVSNHVNNSTNTKLEFTVDGLPSILSDGRLLINLGKELYDKWNAGGKVGSGIKESQVNLIYNQLSLPTGNDPITTIEIIGSNAWIGNIDLPAQANYPIIVGSQITANLNQDAIYTASVKQYDTPLNNQILIGGETFEFHVNVCVRPTIAKLSVAGVTTLTATSTSTETIVKYDWYLNGELIPNVNLPFLTPTENGGYQVAITYVSGCVSVSKTSTVTGLFKNANDSFNSELSDDSDVESASIRVYPNPTRDKINIGVSLDKLNVSKVEIRDVFGKLVFSMDQEDHQYNLEVDATQFSSGLYYVTVRTQDRLLKQVITVSH